MKSLALIISLMLTLAWTAYAADDGKVEDRHWTKDYDHHFRKYAKHYFGPHIDWRWFKAQGIAESGLDPKANSNVGAKGIMQIMPATYEEIKSDNPHFTHINDPRWNIAAGIYYDRKLYRRWKKGLPTEQRLTFALASYNAGYGNINKAFRRAKKKHDDVKRWQEVEPYAPSETKHYVRRIHKLMGEES